MSASPCAAEKFTLEEWASMHGLPAYFNEHMVALRKAIGDSEEAAALRLAFSNLAAAVWSYPYPTQETARISAAAFRKRKAQENLEKEKFIKYVDQQIEEHKEVLAKVSQEIDKSEKVLKEIDAPSETVVAETAPGPLQ